MAAREATRLFSRVPGNPVLRQQTLRARRLAWYWWMGVLLGWVLLSWLVRFGLELLVPIDVWGTGLFPILHMLTFYSMRADILLLLLLLPLQLPRHEWESLRPQLTLTLLSPREVLAGLVAMPLGLLMALHILAGPLVYPLLFSNSFMLPEGGDGERLFYHIVVGTGAVIEDLLFGCICVLAIMGEYLRPGAMMGAAVLRALWTILLTGAAVGVCSFAAALLFLMGPETGNVYVDILVRETGPMAPIFIIEALVITRLWRRALRLVTAAMAGEE